MHKLLASLLPILLIEANSAALTFVSVTSSTYVNRIPSVLPLRVLKLPAVSCNRQCVMDSNCWSWYVRYTNGTDNCVLMGTNLCRQPSLALVNSRMATKWWEKVADFPAPCITRNVSATVITTPLLSTTASSNLSTTTSTLSTVPTTGSTSTSSVTSASTTSNILFTPPSTLLSISTTFAISTTDSTSTSTSTSTSAATSTPFTTPFTSSITSTLSTVLTTDGTSVSTSSSTLTTQTVSSCTESTCKTCEDCLKIQGTTLGPSMVDKSSKLCTFWPNGTNGLSITLPCFDTNKATLLYRKVEVNSTNVTEFVFTPEQMHWIHSTHWGDNLEIRFRTLVDNANVKVFQYKNFSINPSGELSLGNFLGGYPLVSVFGVPVVNAPFVNDSSPHSACGPFWNLSSYPVPNNGTAFNVTPCPGYRIAFYGQPGFYNSIWSSGMAFPFVDTILEMLVYKW